MVIGCHRRRARSHFLKVVHIFVLPMKPKKRSFSGLSTNDHAPKRVAHTMVTANAPMAFSDLLQESHDNTSAEKPPVIPLSKEMKVPYRIRQGCLEKIWEQLRTSLVDTMDLLEIKKLALQEERKLFLQCKDKTVYRGHVVKYISSLRKKGYQPEEEVIEEPPDMTYLISLLSPLESLRSVGYPLRQTLFPEARDASIENGQDEENENELPTSPHESDFEEPLLHSRLLDGEDEVELFASRRPPPVLKRCDRCKSLFTPEEHYENIDNRINECRYHNGFLKQEAGKLFCEIPSALSPVSE